MDLNNVADHFENKNQKNFFDNLFNGIKEEDGAIADEVIRLCNLLQSEYRTYFVKVIENLTTEANKHQCENPSKLPDIYNSICNKRLLTSPAYIVRAFLAAKLDRVSYNLQKFEQYKALTLVVITQLSFKGEHKSKIEQVCNELRQYAKGNRETLAAYLPNILFKNFKEIINDLVNLELSEKLNKTENKTETYSNVKNQISRIRVPFQNVYNNLDGITRHVESKKFKKNGNLQITKANYLDDDLNTSVTVIKELTLTEHLNKNNISLEEELSSTSRTISLVTSTDFVNKSQATQAIKAKAINENIRKKSMNLTCNIYRMTPFELHHLVVDCIEKIQQKNETKNIAKAVLLMLLTGRSFEDITQLISYKNSQHKITGIKKKFQLPTQVVREELKSLIREVSSDYVLPLPLNLVDKLKNFKFEDITSENIKQYLLQLNRKHDMHLSLNKVSSYLTQTLQGNGIDYSIIDLITSNDPKNQPSRFYTYVPYEHLITSFKQYIEHINIAGKTHYLQDLDTNIIKANMGSPLFINDSIVTSLLSLMQNEIYILEKKKNTYFSEQNHNMKVLLLQTVLGLVSGYRPVEGWFGVVNDIHFSTGEYRVAEKEKGIGYNGRVVLIPPTVLTIFKNFLEYCEESISYYGDKNIELLQRYNQSVDGSLPFCFYRYQDKIQEASPTSYAQHIDPIFPLQANWTRHYLRSFLFSQKINDELIGAWMGHIHSNQLPFAQFSQLSRKELTNIQTILEQQITKLLKGIKP